MKQKSLQLDGVNYILQVWMLMCLILMVSRSLFFRHELLECLFLAVVLYGFLVLSAKRISFYTFVFLPVLLTILGGTLAVVPKISDTALQLISKPAYGWIMGMRAFFPEEALAKIGRFFIMHFWGYATKIPYKYDDYMLLAFSVVVGILFYILANRGAIAGLALPIIFFIVQWLRYFDQALGFMNLYLIGFIAYVILNQDFGKVPLKAEAVQSRRRILFVYGISIAITVSLMASMLTAVYPLEKVNGAISKVMPSLFDLRTGYNSASSQIFSFATTIYKPYGDRLGGSIELNRNLVLTVRSKTGGHYLRGRVSDVYDGRNWSSSEPNFNQIKQYTEVEPEHGLEAYTLEITHSNLESATIFAPYSFYTSSIQPQKVYQNADGVLYYKKGTFGSDLKTYTVKGVSDTLSPTLQVGVGMDLKYRKVDRSVPDEVRLIALRATMGSKTAREKMERLTQFLTETYPYTLEVADVPENVDFVHHFLTVTKEGYCTYFASALAVMGRTVGVPTRYVEGFVMPDKVSADGTYQVTADLAHAWVEAYIEGEGWVVFEATPAYTAVARAAEAEDPGDLPLLDMEGRPIPGSEEEDIEDIFAGDATYTPEKPMVTWQEAAVVLLLVLFIIASFRISRIKFALKPQFKSTNRLNAVRQYYQIEALQATIDNTSYRFNTPEKRIERLFDFIHITALDKNVVLLIVNKALYSKHDVLSADLAELEKFFRYVDQYAVARLGRIRYWWYKYVLNAFTLNTRGRQHERWKSGTAQFRGRAIFARRHDAGQGRHR